LLKDLENIIKETFPKDIRYHFELSPDCWTILGDPTQLHQILLNLCINARDAMPNGGDLSVEARNCVFDDEYAALNLQTKAGRYININVSDSGMGIAPEHVDKVFEPFFTTKDLNKGTGLGLSTVMAIVKSHHGVVNVYSALGKGTAFKVYLPAMEPTSREPKDRSEQGSLPHGNGETILVVDDEVSIRTMTRRTLQTFGYQVLTAADGVEALTRYRKYVDKITLVFTDLVMPHMDGAALIQALKKINPAVKIIAISGLSANDGAAKAGVKHFLPKPITAETMLRSVRAVIDETS